MDPAVVDAPRNTQMVGATRGVVVDGGSVVDGDGDGDGDGGDPPQPLAMKTTVAATRNGAITIVMT